MDEFKSCKLRAGVCGGVGVGAGGPCPLKNRKAIGFPHEYWYGQFSIIIGSPAKRHLNGVSLADQ